jgi:hypothetical protein
VIGDLEYLSPGGTLSAFYVCAAITTTSTSNTFTDFVYAVINRTEAAPNGVLSLGYSKSGVFHEVSATALAEPLVFPIRLGLTMNQGSISLTLKEANGRWRRMLNYEVAIADWDWLLQRSSHRAKVMFRFACDVDIDARCNGITVCPMGSDGHREHAVVRYENGEPWRSPEGLYAISLDQVGPTTLATGDAFYVSEYNRSQGAIWLYNADTYAFVRQIATISQKENSRTYGAQEPRIMVDRTDGLIHLYVANWNNVYDATYNPLGTQNGSNFRRQKIQHGTIDSLYGNLIVEVDDVNLGSVTHNSATVALNTVSCYGCDVRKLGGRIFIVYTVLFGTGDRQIGVNRGNAHGTFTHNVWIDGSDGQDEGGNFWDVGPYLYATTGNGSTDTRALLYDTSVLKRTFGAFPGAGTFPALIELLQHTTNGETQCQGIGFSNTSAEGFVDANGGVNLTAWPTIINDLGTFDGEQFERRGNVVFDTRDLEPPQFVWKLSRRSDGTIISTNTLRIAPGESIRAGFDCNLQLILPGGAVLGSMTTPTTESTTISAVKLGIDPSVAKVEVTAASNAADKDEAYVRCTVTNSNDAGPITLLGHVIVKAEP